MSYSTAQYIPWSLSSEASLQWPLAMLPSVLVVNSAAPEVQCSAYPMSWRCMHFALGCYVPFCLSVMKPVRTLCCLIIIADTQTSTTLCTTVCQLTTPVQCLRNVCTCALCLRHNHMYVLIFLPELDLSRLQAGLSVTGWVATSVKDSAALGKTELC